MKKWTEERRKRQAELIKHNKPWLKSTGPKTSKGKRRSRMNALKHGTRAKTRKQLLEALRHNRQFLKHLELYYLQDALEMRMTNELIENRLKSKGMTRPDINPDKQTIDAE